MARKKPMGSGFYCRTFLLAVLVAALLAAPHGIDAEETHALLLATTTSTDNTGLLDYLMPAFSRESGIDILWLATGTGKALKLGENCDVDVLLVHAPDAEKNFVARGFGAERREIMYNDFVVLGPPADPAAVKGKGVVAALEAIRTSGNVFVSRGDNSGTNRKELGLWRLTEEPFPEKESWYRQGGQGMLATINMGAQLGGYTLADRGTYIKYESGAGARPRLVILVEGGGGLLNQYSVIPVSPQQCPNVKYKKAQAFAAWMAGKEAQRLIGTFTLLGKQLFTPNAAR